MPSRTNKFLETLNHTNITVKAKIELFQELCLYLSNKSDSEDALNHVLLNLKTTLSQQTPEDQMKIILSLYQKTASTKKVQTITKSLNETLDTLLIDHKDNLLPITSQKKQANQLDPKRTAIEVLRSDTRTPEEFHTDTTIHVNDQTLKHQDLLPFLEDIKPGSRRYGTPEGPTAIDDKFKSTRKILLANAVKSLSKKLNIQNQMNATEPILWSLTQSLKGEITTSLVVSLMSKGVTVTPDDTFNIMIDVQEDKTITTMRPTFTVMTDKNRPSPIQIKPPPIHFIFERDEKSNWTYYTTYTIDQDVLSRASTPPPTSHI